MFTIYRAGKSMEVQVTWDAVLAEQQTPQEEKPVPQEDSGNQYGDYYGGL